MANLEGAPQLQARLRALETRAPKMILGRSGLRVVREAKLILRVRHTKTAGTERSIRLGKVTTSSAEIMGSRVVGFLEHGTRPHVIRPRRKKALRWAARPEGRRLSGSPRRAAQRGELGGVVFARFVRHPGTRPSPFLAEAAGKAFKAEGANAIIEVWNGAA